jgi:hypothetical protein
MQMKRKYIHMLFQMEGETTRLVAGVCAALQHDAHSLCFVHSCDFCTWLSSSKTEIKGNLLGTYNYPIVASLHTLHFHNLPLLDLSVHLVRFLSRIWMEICRTTLAGLHLGLIRTLYLGLKR